MRRTEGGRALRRPGARARRRPVGVLAAGSTGQDPVGNPRRVFFVLLPLPNLDRWFVDQGRNRGPRRPLLRPGGHPRVPSADPRRGGGAPGAGRRLRHQPGHHDLVHREEYHGLRSRQRDRHPGHAPPCGRLPFPRRHHDDGHRSGLRRHRGLASPGPLAAPCGDWATSKCEPTRGFSNPAPRTVHAT